MAIQDLLTVAIESTFVASVLFFSVQFALFVAANPSPRCRRRYRYVPPTPIATPVQPVSPRSVQTAPSAPVLPAIITSQADANLDAQISHIPDMTALAADSRPYTASLPKAYKTAAKASPKLSAAVITVPALKTYKLRGDDVVLVEDLSSPLLHGCKTYTLRGKQAVKVADLHACRILN
jgi:hypothetical protein